MKGYSTLWVSIKGSFTWSLRKCFLFFCSSSGHGEEVSLSLTTSDYKVPRDTGLQVSIAASPIQSEKGKESKVLKKTLKFHKSRLWDTSLSTQREVTYPLNCNLNSSEREGRGKHYPIWSSTNYLFSDNTLPKHLFCSFEEGWKAKPSKRARKIEGSWTKGLFSLDTT